MLDGGIYYQVNNYTFRPICAYIYVYMCIYIYILRGDVEISSSCYRQDYLVGHLRIQSLCGYFVNPSRFNTAIFYAT